ncbi:MAG: hypothetical protein JSW61_03855 [Candidatus Thorarchaeota archaeon]|nr:MAG: hypothetical protein JSW61_03855 [Candidatus Thorarchaeota archaeon]
MSVAGMDLRKRSVEYIFLCPIHGPTKRQVPQEFSRAIEELKSRVNSTKSMLDSLSCPRCGKVFAVHEIGEARGLLELKARCANGHKELRYLPKALDESVEKTVLKRVLHCDTCSLPSQLVKVENRKDYSRVEISCPVHSTGKKEIPLMFASSLARVADAVSDETLVRQMLRCRDCQGDLSIRSIRPDKSEYKMKCTCVNDHTTEMTKPIDWDEGSTEAIVEALLKCNECELTTEVLEHKVSGRDVEIQILCPLHGTMRKGLTVEVYKHLENFDSKIDRKPSIESSLKCKRCGTPVLIKKVKNRDGYFEVDIECQNDHGGDRYYKTKIGPALLRKIYRQGFECHRCHKPKDLAEIQIEDDKSIALVTCPEHGESKYDIPPEHATAVRDAFMAKATFPMMRELVDERLEMKNEFEYQIDASADTTEMFQIVKNIIDQHDVRMVAESSTVEGDGEAWYYGKALAGDEFVVVGSVSAKERIVRISVSADDAEKMNLLLTPMRENLREVLLKIQAKSDDVEPKAILCARCGAALGKRALPGETSVCEHCGTPLHW